MITRNLLTRLKTVLKAIGLLPAAQWLVHWIRVLLSPAFDGREWRLWLDFVQFKRLYGKSLSHNLGTNGGSKRRALIVSIGFIDGVKVEIGLIKALELAGFKTFVLSSRDPWIIKYYKLAGVNELLYWDDFTSLVDTSKVESVIESFHSFDDMLTFEHEGARVGRIAASTSLRNLRYGSLDFQSPLIREQLTNAIASGMSFASAVKDIVREVHPHVMMVVDRGYTPQGEIFDIFLQANIDTITWNAAHKSNAIVMKRYTLENRDEHPVSLSDKTWHRIRELDWTNDRKKYLRNELSDSYTSGDWYGEVGTQIGKRLLSSDEIRKRLGLDPAKKTAIIFPHILWDGTFFWGKDLFSNYEEWFIETVRAACTNDAVNWVVKVHPANIVKNVRDGVQSEPSEVIALHEHIGQVPPHVFIIPADSEINTFSLFELMDYCITVRGTIGIEAASFGIPVLTGGTGRYEKRGFTIDSDSREQYLERLAHIQDIPPLSDSERELAERFAYGVFVLRPLPLSTVTLEYQKDAKASIKSSINAQTKEDWLKAPDIRAFAEWVSDSNQPDFLMPMQQEVS